MSEILITDVTVTVTERQIVRQKKIVRGTISFGNGILAVAPGGVPLPQISAFGYIRQIDNLELYPSDDNSLQPYTWNSTSNRLVPLVQELDPEVEGKLTEVNAHATGTGFASMAADDMAGDVPLQTVLRFVATGW